MSDHDDYLWDRSGEPDPIVQKLEATLAGLAHDGRELELPEPPESTGRVVRGWPWMLALAAAAGITIGAIVMWPAAALHVGADKRTFVATKEPLTIPMGELISITLEPDSKLHFEHWRSDEALLRLERGSMRARVAPPPAVPPDFFLVDTALGRVTDKGCQYVLGIESDGTNVVRVTEGAVTFSFSERTVYVPADASTRVTAKGPSTPMFTGSSAELRQAVRIFDKMTQDGEGPKREKGMFAVTQACTTPGDTLVLWHLLRDDDELLREQAEERLLDLVGPPPGELIGKGRQTWDPEVWLAYLRIGPWMEAK